jgi:hypothetical protein
MPMLHALLGTDETQAQQPDWGRAKLQTVQSTVLMQRFWSWCGSLLSHAEFEVDHVLFVDVRSAIQGCEKLVFDFALVGEDVILGELVGCVYDSVGEFVENFELIGTVLGANVLDCNHGNVPLPSRAVVWFLIER